jgi:hypothetical protein
MSKKMEFIAPAKKLVGQEVRGEKNISDGITGCSGINTDSHRKCNPQKPVDFSKQHHYYKHRYFNYSSETAYNFKYR